MFQLKYINSNGVKDSDRQAVSVIKLLPKFYKTIAAGA